MQLLAGLSPEDASGFALVTNAAAQTTAKLLTMYTRQALRPIFDEVHSSAYSLLHVYIARRALRSTKRMSHHCTAFAALLQLSVSMYI